MRCWGEVIGSAWVVVAPWGTAVLFDSSGRSCGPPEAVLMLRLSRSSLVLHDLSICPHEIGRIVVGQPARDTRSLESRPFLDSRVGWDKV